MLTLTRPALHSDRRTDDRTDHRTDRRTDRADRRAARRRRRDERRRLRRLDALSLQLAGLHDIDAVLETSVEVVRSGWVQNAWFRVDAPRGERAVSGPDVRSARRHPVVGACLVGSVVEAAGGIDTVRSMRVQRALDLVWHTLREDAERPVRWCPGPSVRMIHTMDLTHWNDEPERSADEVVDLLHAARHTLVAERVRLQAQRESLTTA